MISVWKDDISSTFRIQIEDDDMRLLPFITSKNNKFEITNLREFGEITLKGKLIGKIFIIDKMKKSPTTFETQLKKFSKKLAEEEKKNLSKPAKSIEEYAKRLNIKKQTLEKLGKGERISSATLEKIKKQVLNINDFKLELKTLIDKNN